MDRASGLKIAVDGRPALWGKSGIGTIAANFISRIEAADPANRYWFYFDRPTDGLLPCCPTRCRVGRIANPFLWANTWLPAALRRDSIDIYISFLEKDTPWISGRTKVVTMVHDLIPLRFPETMFRNALHSIYYRSLLAASIRKSHCILTNSAYSLREISEGFPQASAKLRQITLGVSVDERQMEPVCEVRGKYKIPGSYFLAIGSTEPRKNNAAVIRAFNLLRSEQPELSLAIVGKTWRGRQFPAQLLNEQVVQVGAVSDGELWTLMANAVALVFPSLHEGFGLPVVDSMALGAPVITSRRGALPEVGGEAVAYVDPESDESICMQMRNLLSDRSLRRTLGERGRERASLFRWDKMCEEVVALYPEMLAAR